MKKGLRVLVCVRRSVGCVLIASLAIAISGCDFFASADSRLVRARTSIEAGDFVEAMTQLKTSLEDHPDHVASRLQLVDVSLQLGDAAAAERELERATASGATREQVLPLQYRVLYAQQNFAQMLKLLETDQSSVPEDRALLRSQAEAGLGQLQQAKASAEEAVRLAPQDSRASLQLARTLAVLGDTEQAAQIAAGIKQPPDVLAQALSLQGALSMNKGEYAKARDLFTDAAEVGRKALGAREQLLVSASLTEANLALQDADAADKSLAAVAAWAPKAVLTYYLRGRIALLRNDYTAAVAECQRALNIDPTHTPSQLLLAGAHLGHGSLEQAEAVLEQLLATQPGNSAARKLLAQVYIAKDRPRDAQRILSSLGDAEAGKADTEWLMGTALSQAGDRDAGLEYLERSAAASPGSVDKQLNLAGFYLAAGKREQSLQILGSLPPEVAQTQRARRLLLAANTIGKTPAEARREIEQLVAAPDADAELLSIAGSLMVSLGDTPRGKELLERAAALDKKAIAPRMALASLAASHGDYATAQKLLQDVLVLNARYQPAYIASAELALRRGDRAQAAKWLEQAIGADPGAVIARIGLARLMFASADAARGRDLLNQAIAVAGNDRARALLAAGRVLVQAGLYEEALARFAEAGAAGNADGYLDAARANADLGRLEQARQNAQAALVRRPGWIDAKRLLVMLNIREGNIDAAIAEARDVAEGGGSPAAALELEGDVRMLAKQFDLALAAYHKAQRARSSGLLAIKIYEAGRAASVERPEAPLRTWLEAHPDDVDVRRVLADYYDATGQRQLAIAHYEQLVKAHPHDAVLLNNTAWLLHTANDGRALDMSRRAYELAPQNPAIADTYGWLLVQTDKVKEGLPVLERALAAAPAQRDIAYHVAAARSKAGDRDGAMHLLDEILKSDTVFAERRSAEGLRSSLNSRGSDE